MIKKIKAILSTLGTGKAPGARSSDFSDFFSKSSGDKAKIIREVLREANEEQRKVVQEYHRDFRTTAR